MLRWATVGSEIAAGCHPSCTLLAPPAFSEPAPALAMVMSHCVALCCVASHCIAVRCVALRCIALHCTALQQQQQQQQQRVLSAAVLCGGSVRLCVLVQARGIEKCVRVVGWLGGCFCAVGIV